MIHTNITSPLPKTQVGGDYVHWNLYNRRPCCSKKIPWKIPKLPYDYHVGLVLLQPINRVPIN